MTKETKGMLIGFIGVAIFSLTLPFTRIAVQEMTPFYVSFGIVNGLCRTHYSKQQGIADGSDINDDLHNYPNLSDSSKVAQTNSISFA